LKLLVGAFLFIGIGGLLTDHIGAGLVSLCAAGFMYYGVRYMKKDEAAYWAHPDRAATPLDTVAMLEQNHSETSRTDF
jgi:hypothetical protein